MHSKSKVESVLNALKPGNTLLCVLATQSCLLLGAGASISATGKGWRAEQPLFCGLHPKCQLQILCAKSSIIGLIF